MISCKQRCNRVSRMGSDADMSAMPTPRYARFSRRLRAMLFDWIIALIVIYGAVLLVASVGSDNFSRALGVLVIVALLLYEPILVSRIGGTLGHYFNNLRVVDEDNGGNISFLKACARVVIKGVLGLYSFVILAATRRNQAVHDLLTGSTVQMRDPIKALPGQYIIERAELAATDMPSLRRRLAVICGYLLLTAIVYLLIICGIIAAGVISDGCIDRNVCSAGERILSLNLGLTLLGASAACIALGWRGRLIGARRTS
jgi:uncharacterized RDD family membrane protein YckC